MFRKFGFGKTGKSQTSSTSQSEPAARTRHASEGSTFSFLEDKPARGRLEVPTTLRSRSTSKHARALTSPSPGDNSALKPTNTTNGLHVVHQPSSIAPVDIIFIHGLGGDSRLTWSRDHDPALFWPQLWLPVENHLRDVRILTFGYNANFRPGSAKSMAGVGEFAKELLFELKFARDSNGDELGISRVPIIFVAHSMGGLVVKKACLLGQSDPEFQDLVQSVSSVLFLATPHRGADLAEALSKVLSATLQAPKRFVDELCRNSYLIEDLNEQFRHVASRLEIWSFYEQLATTVGPTKMKILDMESSVLGYPGERSQPLDANHHNVCKFSDVDDSNYKAVRNALVSVVQRFRSQGVLAVDGHHSEELDKIRISIGPGLDMESEFLHHRKQWIPNTCGWIFHEPSMDLWMNDPSPRSRILWYNAPPGTGKSVLSSQIIHRLRSVQRPCQFFFFKDGDQANRTLAAMFRSITHQLVATVPEFKRALLSMVDHGHSLNNMDSSALWREVFEATLFRMSLEKPVYWVIDALDESDHSKRLVGLLRSINDSTSSIRILLVSRKTDTLAYTMQRVSEVIPVDVLEKTASEQNRQDIRLLLQDRMKDMRGSPKFKTSIEERMTERAQGNFLWARLVLEEIQDCHTVEAIQEAMEDIPDGMTEMYEHMEAKLLLKRRKGDIRLCKSLLQHVICAQRVLSLTQLTRLLSPEHSEILDLRRTIHDLCGQFVLVDNKSYVSTVHQTARDYLIKVSSSEICVSTIEGHSSLFEKSMEILCALDLHTRISSISPNDTESQTEFYASTAWTYHLKRCEPASDTNLTLLVKFFNSKAALVWVHLLSLDSRLAHLVKAAKVLSGFSKSMRQAYRVKSPLLHRLSDLDLLDRWSLDLVRLAGKFSSYIITEPPCIYSVIPAVCPDESAIFTQFYDPRTTKVLVSGIQNQSWSDNLARWSMPREEQAWQIICTQNFIAVLSSAHCVYVWSSHDFSQACKLDHKEPITDMRFSNRGSMLITYGLRTTKLWSVPNGLVVATVANPLDVKAMALAFCANDTRVFCASNDRIVRTISVDSFSGGWRVLNPSLLQEDTCLQGTVINSPMCMAFNGDSTQVGVSYRGFPLSVWSLHDGKCIRRCGRAQMKTQHHRPSDNWFAVDRFTWNPVSGHVIGLYRDGCVFKWHPITNENQEAQSAADEVAASDDGRLFITSNTTGNLRIWNFAYFTPIYQLSSEDLVTGLALSPDHRRFYDVRGSEINAWEPITLARLSSSDDLSSDAASEEQLSTSRSEVSQAAVTRHQAVVAIAVSPTSSLYCFGTEEGLVKVCEARTGRSTELTAFHNMLGVNHLEWSSDGTHVGAADLAGDISVIRVRDEGGALLKEPVCNPKVELNDQGIHQLLFNHSAMLLFVASEDLCLVVSVASARVVCSASIQEPEGSAARASYHWLRHPTDPAVLLAFTGRTVRGFFWDSLAEVTNQPYLNASRQAPAPAEVGAPRDEEAAIDVASSIPINLRAMFCQDNAHILTHINWSGSHRGGTKQMILFNKSLIGGKDALRLSNIPAEVNWAAEIALGVLDDSILVFIDKDLWVCTYHLGSKFGVHQRHFFIPRDWVTLQDIQQCRLMSDGTLLCPKDDSVAIMRGGLNSLGF